MSASAFNLLYFPDEILIKIALYLNARERVALGNSCTRFCSLIFGDKTFFRDLDFSEDGYLTAPSDVRRYFQDQTMYKHTMRINLNNMYCKTPGLMLEDISRAKNLVEVNVITIDFKDVKELASFLNPLEKLRKLSVAWPPCLPEQERLLEKPIKRLKHLTVTVEVFSLWESCVPVLSQFWNELEQLYLLALYVKNMHQSVSEMRTSWNSPLKLRIAAGYYDTGNIGSSWMPIRLTDYEQWTTFHSRESKQFFYYGVFLFPPPILGVIERIDECVAEIDVFHLYIDSLRDFEHGLRIHD